MSVAQPAARAKVASRRGERLFYGGMAVAVAATVFAGFSRTYFLRPWYGHPPLAPLLHVHGLVFSSWVLLLLVQTFLVAAGRTPLHRRLGVLGGVIAAAMIVLGCVTAVIRAAQGAAPPGLPPLVFLVIPLTDMLVFGTLVGAAFRFRRQSDTHKRLMLLATFALLPAAIARLPFAVMQAGPLAFFGFTDLFVVALIAYDLASRGRVHRATAWGALIFVASQPLRLLIGGTDAWMRLATWLTHLVPQSLV